MSFEMVRAKKLFCQKYTPFFFIPSLHFRKYRRYK